MRVLLVALTLLAAIPGGAAAAIPEELTRDPLERGALIALPSVYRLEASFSVEAIVTRDGTRRPVGREVRVAGTAFGVATGGGVLTADHLISDDSATLAVAIATDMPELLRGATDRPRGWVERTGARATGAVLKTVTLRDLSGAPAIRARVERRDREADMALLRVAGVDAPALSLDDGQSIDTPVVAIGFAGREPELRPGRLARTGTIAGRGERVFTQIRAPIERGDSGGPAVDAAGRVRGMVITRAAVGANLVPAVQIRAFVGPDAVGAPSGAQRTWEEGLRSFWSLDFTAARAAMEDTRIAYPAHPLAARYAGRAAALRGADVSLTGPDGVRSFLRALAVSAALICLVLAGLLIRHDVRADHWRRMRP